MIEPQYLRLPAGAAVFNPSLIDASTLRRVLAARPNDISTPLPDAAGRAGVRLIVHDGQNWVWRHNRRGGLAGRLIRDSYLWLGEKRTRTFREWHLLNWLHRQGLPVPQPVAACYRRRGLAYECDLITVYLPQTMTLGARLARGPLAREGWAAVGDCIRRFHDQGVCHADLNAHNILMGHDGRVFLVDFDRGRRRGPGRWVDQNWARLHRSLRKIGQGAPAGSISPGVLLALRVQHRLPLAVIVALMVS